jgi:septum site-determining protein MinD
VGKSWMIASGKGGVGKSTLTAALGEIMAKQNRRVAIVDGDIGLKGIDLMLDIQDRIIFDLHDYILGRCTLGQALVKHPQFPDLSVISSPVLSKASDIRPDDMHKLVQSLKRRFDIVLLDCPAGIGRNLKNTIGAADECILVTTPDDIAVRDAERAADIITGYGQARPYLVVNRVIRRMVASGEMQAPHSIAAHLDMNLLGTIPDDASVYRALLRKKTAAECENVAVRKSIEHIALRMQGQKVPQEVYELPGLFRKFYLHMLKGNRV